MNSSGEEFGIMIHARRPSESTHQLTLIIGLIVLGDSGNDDILSMANHSSGRLEEDGRERRDLSPCLEYYVELAFWWLGRQGVPINHELCVL